MFNIKNIRKTLVTRIQRKLYLIASRIVWVFLKWVLLICRIMKFFWQFKPITEYIQEKNKIWPTSMAWILSMTKCAPWSKIGRPWLKVIEYITTYDYLLCLFFVGFIKKCKWIQKTSYAQDHNFTKSEDGRNRDLGSADSMTIMNRAAIHIHIQIFEWIVLKSLGTHQRVWLMDHMVRVCLEL